MRMKNAEILKRLYNIQDSLEWILNCDKEKYKNTQRIVLENRITEIKIIKEEIHHRENKRLLK